MGPAGWARLPSASGERKPDALDRTQGLLGGTECELVENLNRIIRHLYDQDEMVGLNVQGKGEKGTTCAFALGEADDRSDVGLGHQTELESIRRDALLGPYEPAEQLSPFEELGPGVARFERAGDRYLHGFQCTSESIAAVGGCQGERFANWSDDG